MVSLTPELKVGSDSDDNIVPVNLHTWFMFFKMLAYSANCLLYKRYYWSYLAFESVWLLKIVHAVWTMVSLRLRASITYVICIRLRTVAQKWKKQKSDIRKISRLNHCVRVSARISFLAKLVLWLLLVGVMMMSYVDQADVKKRVKISIRIRPSIIVFISFGQKYTQR